MRNFDNDFFIYCKFFDLSFHVDTLPSW